MKLDRELLPIYYKGQNEPVGIWVTRHYKYFILNGFKNCSEKATIEDAIQDIAQTLIEYEKEVRPIKFKPQRDNVKGALMMRIRGRIIDLFRKGNRKQVVTISEELPAAEYSGDDAEQEFFNERKKWLEKFKTQLPPQEQEFLSLMMVYGPGKLAPIIEELGISLAEGRTIKQRIKRKIDRSILNN